MKRPPPFTFKSSKKHILLNKSKTKKNMKATILKISVFILLFSFMGAGCKKDKEEDLSYLDYTKAFYGGMPGFAIYKTKKDYFFNVPIRPFEDYYQSPEIEEKSGPITLFNGQYYFSERYRLNDDYVVSTWIDKGDYFTSLTYDQYVREKLSPTYNQGATNSKVINSIVDRDPFTEFYRSQGSFDGMAGITINELNQLIKEKNLEKYFKKLK